jgi:hypothetical protein
LRGQFDVCDKPMNGGKPYANKITFNPHEVKLAHAQAMFNTLRKLETYTSKHQPLGRNDEFQTQLLVLCGFLNMSKILIAVNPKYSNLSVPSNFVEYNLTAGIMKVKEMLSSFVVKPA